jgi:general secretion pathway protein G
MTRSGFRTLAGKSLLVVFGVLACVFLSSCGGRDALSKSRESILKDDLQMMREAIDSYTLDLVDAGYLQELPIDPISLKRDWAPQIGDIPLNPKGTAHGIYDVRSNSGKSASDGTALNAW